MVNVTVEARNDVDNPGVVKVQGEAWELNIRATTDELWKLADIEKTDWVQRRTLKVGTCANAPVWWNERDGTVYIVVGNDDVTWDLGVTVSLAIVHKLLAELGEPPEVIPPPFGPTLFLLLSGIGDTRAEKAVRRQSTATAAPYGRPEQSSTRELRCIDTERTGACR